MKQGHFIDDLAKSLSKAAHCIRDSIPPGVHQAQKDVEKNFHAILKDAFSKLDLVTREEFDVQAKVLAKTRQKLEALEKHVAELESKHKPAAHTKK